MISAIGALVGSADGSSTASATIGEAPQGGIAGSASGSSTASAAISGIGALVGTASGISTASAVLDAPTPPPASGGSIESEPDSDLRWGLDTEEVAVARGDGTTIRRGIAATRG